MTAQIVKWLIASWIVLGCVVMVVRVGRERLPITGGQAAFALIINAAIFWAILTYWQE